MTLTSDLQSHGESAVEVPDDGATKVAGRSPAQLAVARFRGDRLSMVALVVSTLIVLCAISAPILVAVGVLNPNEFHQNLLAHDGVNPEGRFGGVSWDHPLGVEPCTGRDLLSRLMLAMTWSLGIALTATLMTCSIGVVLGIISGFSGGLVDATVGRFIDLTLSFPQTMMLLALSGPAVLLLRTDVADIPGLGLLARPRPGERPLRHPDPGRSSAGPRWPASCAARCSRCGSASTSRPPG